MLVHSYQEQDKWGYAPAVAQGWRATKDHHDEWSSVIEQISAVKGKGSWSGPYGWAYLDMMMTGGQGCESQVVGGSGESGKVNWTVPMHCPGMTDNEYRSEASIYVIVSSPMLIGTDLRCASSRAPRSHLQWHDDGIHGRVGC